MKHPTKDVSPDIPNIIYGTLCGGGVSISLPSLHFVKAMLLNTATDLDAVRIEDYNNVIMAVACKSFL